ncbi:MAG: 50S ribosomal protein L11 methyltransferase, partial [Acidimicrobiales bacterium]
MGKSSVVGKRGVMGKRVSQAAARAVRSGIGFGASKLASNDWLMGLVYDLTNETNFAGLSEHEEMLSDHVRVNTYHAAIHNAVKPGDVVLDLGTGTGLLAFMAVKAGAAKVYAVEHSDFIDVAREIAQHNNITNI